GGRHTPADLRGGGVGQGRPRVGAGDVTGGGRPADLVGQARDPAVVADVVDRDRETVGSQAQGCRVAKALRRSGDESDVPGSGVGRHAQITAPALGDSTSPQYMTPSVAR